MALEIESEKVKAVAKLLQRCCYAKSEIEKEKVRSFFKAVAMQKVKFGIFLLSPFSQLIRISRVWSLKVKVVKL